MFENRSRWWVSDGWTSRRRVKQGLGTIKYDEGVLSEVDHRVVEGGVKLTTVWTTNGDEGWSLRREEMESLVP